MSQQKIKFISKILWDIAPGHISPVDISPFKENVGHMPDPFLPKLKEAVSSFVPYAQQNNIDVRDPNVFLSRAAEDVRVFLISTTGEPWGFPLCDCAHGQTMQLNSFVALHIYNRDQTSYNHRVQNMNWSHSYTCPSCDRSTGFPTFKNSAHIHLKVAQSRLERKTA